MIIRLILTILLVCSLSGQVVSTIDVSIFNINAIVFDEELFLKEISDKALAKEMNNEESTIIFLQDTLVISVEEQFLKEISDKALAKEERRKKITNRVLITIVAILLIDRFINK